VQVWVGMPMQLCTVHVMEGGNVVEAGVEITWKTRWMNGED